MPTRAPGNAGRPQADMMNENREHRPGNRLAHATSPYLLQHAANPIDWQEWGREALRSAADQDRPIFLSIGYSACHWCHVMAHETFEDAEVADVLNRHFVSIKVDREERPDLDEIYMQITQAMNEGHGGWPMTLFLTSDGRPFFAATYLSRDDFLTLILRIRQAWAEERDELLASAGRAAEYLTHWARGPLSDPRVIPVDLVDKTAQALAGYFDLVRGGLRSSGNKFPPTLALELMLRVYRRRPDRTIWQAVEVTLDQMARGGIYDHLGGGICRYSTDPQWLVPHFEKMLYDQALVSSVYLDAFQASRDPRWAAVARGILDYVLRDLHDPAGGFYSTRDADSEGLEGAYYVWTVEQVVEVLGPDEGRLCCAFFDVSPDGNWFEDRGHAPEGPKNILRILKPPPAFAAQHGLTPAELLRRIGLWREKLLAARSRRVPPGLDDKVLTDWNGLMIAGLAKAAAVLDEPKYAAAAARAADFLLTHARVGGHLLRVWRDGRARLPAYLSDYAFLVEGLLNLYEATFERRWLVEAVALNETMIQCFSDGVSGAFFFSAHDGEPLIARTRNPYDGAIPSGNSVAASNLLRLAVILDRPDFRRRAEEVFRAFRPLVDDSPASFERLLAAVDLYHDRLIEVAVIGRPDDADTRRLRRAVYEPYLPNKIVMSAEPDDPAAAEWPLLRGKAALGGRATAYVCEGYACQRPVTTPDGLAELLGTAPRAGRSGGTVDESAVSGR